MAAANKGLESFFEVLNLIKNPDKYDTKIAELKAVTAQYTASVEAVVALSNVQQYTQSIRQREEDSKKALEDAKAEATALAVSGRTKADKMLKHAQEVSQKAVEDSEVAAAKLDAANAREAAVAASMATLAKAWEEFNAKEKALAELGVELEERKKKLLAAMG